MSFEQMVDLHCAQTAEHWPCNLLLAIITFIVYGTRHDFVLFTGRVWSHKYSGGTHNDASVRKSKRLGYCHHVNTTPVGTADDALFNCITCNEIDRILSTCCRVYYQTIPAATTTSATDGVKYNSHIQLLTVNYYR